MAYRALPTNDDMPTVFHEWLHWLPLYEDKPVHTVRAYGQGVRRIVSFAEIPPERFGPTSLDQASLTDTVRAMRADGEIAKATINQTLAALKSFYDFCVADRLADNDEVPNIARIRKVAKLDTPRGHPDFYMPTQIRQLYEEAAKGVPGNSRIRWASRDLAMCSFLAVLGLRTVELITANVNWVSDERLNPADGASPWMVRVEGKGRKHRQLPLSSELLAAHTQWQAERVDRFGRSQGDDPLFVTNDGSRFNYQRLRYWHRLLSREAGLPLRTHTLHTLRHTAGVQMAAEGVPMNLIQSMLGHENLNTTGIYTALAGEQLIEVVERSGANKLLGDALQEAGR
jgi:site-specific recombinase XerD